MSNNGCDGSSTNSSHAVTVYFWRSRTGLTSSNTVLFKLTAIAWETALLPAISMLTAISLYCSNRNEDVRPIYGLQITPLRLHITGSDKPDTLLLLRHDRKALHCGISQDTQCSNQTSREATVAGSGTSLSWELDMGSNDERFG